MSCSPRLFRARKTRTGRWVGEAHTPGDRHREWTPLTGGVDENDTYDQVVQDFAVRRGQCVQFPDGTQVHAEGCGR